MIDGRLRKIREGVHVNEACCVVCVYVSECLVDGRRSSAPSKAAATAESITINRISDVGFNHSEVVDTAAYLADEIGGRMTNSPAMRKAERWTQEKFKSWGLKDVRSEGFRFRPRLVDRVRACADDRAQGLWSCARIPLPGRPRPTVS